MKIYLTFSLLILFMGITSEVTSQCIAGKQVMLANGETSIDVCSSQRIKLRPGSNAGLNVFAITNDDGIIEAMQPKNIVDLSKLTPGSKRVYSVSWFGVLQQPIGEDINSAVFADFCYELSTNFVSLNLVGGSTGEISPVNEIVCFDGAATLEANHANFSLGTGYELIYVLTKGSELVIQNVSAEPNFTVAEAGEYIIHPLVYDPMTLDLSIVVPGVTTGFDVNGLLSQGGGDICASLDVAGAPFTVVDPNPGQLSPSSESICFSSSDIDLVAEVIEQSDIPDGYNSIYVLTMGSGLVITQVSSEPSFTVNDTGLYTIHTLIYDPNTLDLGIVVPGETTGFDVNGLLVQGGGSICARLDVAGAKFNIVSPDAGTLEPQGESTICGGESSPLVAIVNDSPIVPVGFTTLYVLTRSDDLTIMAVSDQPSFEVAENGHYTIHTLVYNPETLDLSIVEFGSTTGFDVNSLLVQGGGSICGSLLVDGASFSVVKPDAGTLTPTSDIACGDGSSILLEAERDGETVIPDGFQLIYVLTSGAELVIQDASSSPSFSVNTGGLYTIHTLVYDPKTLDLGIIQFGTTTGVDVNGLLVQGGGSICASLDVAGAAFSANVPSAGTLIGGETFSCSSGPQTLEASVDEQAFLPEGYEQIYVLTKGSGLVIQAVNATPVFEVDQSGLYTIHSLVYDPLTLDLGIVVFGETTGFNVNGLLVQGGGGICGSLDVTGTVFSIGPDAGTLAASSSSCLSDGEVTLTAMSNGDAVVLDGFESLYVLTSGEDLVIQQVSAEPAFTVQDEGSYTIHTLVYNPSTLDLSIVVPGVTTGGDINGLLVQGGGQICASLDVAGAKFNVADPQAGTLVPVTSVFCAGNDPIAIEASTQGDAVVPDGYSTIYVLTSGDDLIIEAVSPIPVFEVQAPNSYTIHTLVYDTSTLDLGIVQIGVTSGFDVNGLLAQGGGSICASLDVVGAKFSIGPSAGTLTASPLEGCNMQITLTAEIASAPYLPAGYQQLFVLTKGEGLVIEQVGSEPTFIVEENGMYTIHTLVYDPATLDLSIVVPGETTGFDVNGLLVQGGGSICAALDVAGAGFTVSVADAGTLNAPFSFVCFAGSETTITAEVVEPASIPTGYSQIYVLTSGDELIIQDVSSTPSFDVSSGGSYTIHSLVYDSSTLDLGIVVPGETSGFDVNGLLIQGGGNICASLDVAGARYTVGPDAGTLAPLSTSGCTGSFKLEAGIDGKPYIPEGYTGLFVLTEGANLVIQGVSENPTFEVSSPGFYTIHSLVYDPLTLDLGIVEFGVTTGVDVNGLLIQGGGSICASLDVAGAVFEATGPVAGTLISEETLACFTGSPVSLNAQHVDEPLTPAGYSILYVLTQGDNLVIQQVGAEPSFEVTIAGDYTIHTLVYDENTLDLSIVVPGVTTGGDVNSLLVQGGGSICAALDVSGSKISVGPTAGTLVADNPTPMLDGMGTAMLQASVGDDPVVPEGFSLIYVLTSGDDLVIQNVSATPMFEVSAAGKYTVHTLVYDTATLDLGIVEVGVTTGVDVNGLLVQGGGSICAALDVAGAVFDVSSAMARSGLEIVNVWYHAGIIYAEIEASKSMLTPLQVFHPGGLEVVARRESISQGYNLLEVALAVENPASLYFVKIENQVFKIMKDW